MLKKMLKLTDFFTFENTRKSDFAEPKNSFKHPLVPYVPPGHPKKSQDKSNPLSTKPGHISGLTLAQN